MEIRTLTPDDIPYHDRLMSEAFGRGARPTWDTAQDAEKRAELSLCNRTGVFDGIRLVATATVLDMSVYWDSQIVRLGGIAGVACTADRRGEGHVGALLNRNLIDMRESGQFISGLNPFAFGFYRRYGWDWVGEKRITTLPFELLEAHAESRNVVMLEGLDAKEKAAVVYDNSVKRYRGAVARDQTVFPNFWKRTLDHHDGRTTYVHVYQSPSTGEPEGYFICSLPGSGDKMIVPEFFAETPRAESGLLGALHYYGTQFKLVELTRPFDDPLTLSIMHWDVDVKLKPLFMGRIVDLTAAFAGLDAPDSVRGEAVISVTDSHCDWNNGSFKLVVEGGRITVNRTTGNPDVVTDIQILTQAYWGRPGLAALRDAGRVIVTGEDGYKLLSKLLPESNSYVGDFF
jgi:predicted acetyltransferase